MFDHVGLHVSSFQRSKAFYSAVHTAGVSAGGTDNGAPGPRTAEYPYYAAFLLDPDGNNVEAGFRGS